VSVLNPITYSQKHWYVCLPGGGYGIISAGRNPAIPSDVNLSDETIVERTRNLTADVTDSFVYAPIIGVYDGGREESIFFMLYNAAPRRERRLIMKTGSEI
jgi:hypothetical protein